MCWRSAENIVEILSYHQLSCAIVDSDGQYGILLAKVVDDLGFAVSVFGDSKNFECEYKKRRFDVVVISWNIKPSSGSEVVGSIKAIGEPYPALIVGCDGGDSASFQLALSPVGFLFKPFDARHLMEVLEKAVEAKR